MKQRLDLRMAGIGSYLHQTNQLQRIALTLKQREDECT